MSPGYLGRSGTSPWVSDGAKEDPRGHYSKKSRAGGLAVFWLCQTAVTKGNAPWGFCQVLLAVSLTKGELLVCFCEALSWLICKNDCSMLVVVKMVNQKWLQSVFVMIRSTETWL